MDVNSRDTGETADGFITATGKAGSPAT